MPRLALGERVILTAVGHVFPPTVSDVSRHHLAPPAAHRTAHSQDGATVTLASLSTRHPTLKLL
jgi:hypothetical protein